MNQGFITVAKVIIKFCEQPILLWPPLVHLWNTKCIEIVLAYKETTLSLVALREGTSNRGSVLLKYQEKVVCIFGFATCSMGNVSWTLTSLYEFWIANCYTVP